MDEIVEALEALEKASIQYCVLRNYQFASGGDIDGDVDILVRERDQKRVREVFQDAGFYPFEGDTTRQTKFRGYVGSIAEIVSIDVYWDAPTYNGIPLVDGSRVIENRTRYKNIWIPSAEDYFVELVFHPLLNKNHYRPHYRNELKRLSTKVDRSLVREHANDIFGYLGCRLTDYALNGEFELILKYKWLVVLYSVLSRPNDAPTLFWNLIVLREIIRPIRNLLEKLQPWKPSPVIALVGPDGVGKSSVAKEICTTLNNAGIDAQTSKLGVHSGATRLLDFVRDTKDVTFDCLSKRQFGLCQESDSESSSTSSTDTILGSRTSTVGATVLVIDWFYRYVHEQVTNDGVIIAHRYLHELPVYADPGPLSRLYPITEPNYFFGVILTDDLESLTARSEFDEKSIKEFQRRLSESGLKTVTVGEGPDETAKKLLQEVFDTVLSERSCM